MKTNSVILSIGAYGHMYHVEATPQELMVLCAILPRLRPVCDDYRGRFEVKPTTTETRLALTVVTSDTIVEPVVDLPDPSAAKAPQTPEPTATLTNEE